MYSRKVRLGSLLLLLLLTAPAWAQSTHYSVPAASMKDQFSAYYATLSDAADNLLHPGTPEPAVSGSQFDDSRLRQFAQQYWDGREQNVSRAAERIVQLRPALDPILHEEGIPADLAALVLVESGGRTTALSPKGALGLWQLMPETARRYGLAVSPGQDERVDVVKSTRAAARYLRHLYTQFGDWNLVFAAYNSGEQTVQRALAHNGARDFVSLSRSSWLPLETRNYVPAVLSAMRLLGLRPPDYVSVAQGGSAGLQPGDRNVPMQRASAPVPRPQAKARQVGSPSFAGLKPGPSTLGQDPFLAVIGLDGALPAEGGSLQHSGNPRVIYADTLLVH